MDNEHDDSPFVVAFPLPFRVLFLAGLGILGWAANLHGLRLLGVDPASTLDLRTHERGSASPLPLSVDSRHAHGALEAPAYATTPPCSAVYRLALWYGLWCSAAWALYRSATNGDSFVVDSSKHIPSVCALVVLICMISPYDVMQKLERDAFIMYVFVRPSGRFSFGFPDAALSPLGTPQEYQTMYIVTHQPPGIFLGRGFCRHLYIIRKSTGRCLAVVLYATSRGQSPRSPQAVWLV